MSGFPDDPELPRRLGRLLRHVVARARRAGGQSTATLTRADRSQQELSETAMALLTLWATFEDHETPHVARTTRALLAGLTVEDLGHLVLHMAGLTRGLLHHMSGQHNRDIDQALQVVARGVHDRGSAD